MKKKRKLNIFLLVLILLLSIGYSLFQISKSRSFQFFGGIVPSVITEEKVVALTFDDGPTEYTKYVLEVLKEKDIKATFFVIGKDLEKNFQLGKDIVSDGHELGNHTYSHQRMVLKKIKFVEKEIKTTNQLIRNTGYLGKIYFRPPYGKKLFTLPWYLLKNEMLTVTWDVEPDSYGNSSEFLVNYTLENTKQGSIILLHPFCENCGSQREALSKIIDRLQERGYKFVTISELLSYER